MFGKVKDCLTGKPLSNASIQVWEASTNGLYSQQDDKQIDHNLHGKFVTGVDGKYPYYCLRPTPYPVPNDGPAGKLLELLDRHPYRPAHIPLTVRSPAILILNSYLLLVQVIVDGYKPVTTLIFDKASEYLDDDSVFAVKDSLLVDFVKRDGDSKAELQLEYDITMIPATKTG
jgi:catechol 1,2-dioxygenase